MQLPDEIVIEACKALQARAENAGSWPNGFPPIFHKIRELGGWVDDDMWFHTAETLVRTEAVRLVSERFECTSSN